MKNQPFTQKLANAIAGIRFTFNTERNFRTHTLLGTLLIIVMLIVQPTLIWWALMLLCIGLVLAAELANTAIETLADHLHPDLHPAIGKVKDIMAGMVLVMSMAAALVGLLAIIDRYAGYG